LDEKVVHVTKKIKSIKVNGISVKETYEAQRKSVTQQQAELSELEKAAEKFEQEAKAQEAIRGVSLGPEDLVLYSSK